MPKIQFKLNLNKEDSEGKKRVFKMPGLKSHKQLVVDKKKLIKHAALVAALISFVIIFGSLVDNILPYAVSVNDEDICYMSKAESEKFTEQIAQDYIPEGATLKGISSDGAITIDKCFKLVSRNSFVSTEEAVVLLQEALDNNDGEDINITAISAITTLESYTPEPNLERNDKMLAGEEKVKKKGKNGKKNVTRTYITVNGTIENVEVSKEEIVKRGKPATIMRGTLGLPEGADWRTYDGDPVYEDGDAVATTAVTYLGAPYKYGGKSLTTGIDCVWFVVKMYEKYGVNLPANHPGLKSVGTGVSIANAKRGDIVCYDKHVCIYLGKGKVVEASSRSGVRVSRLKKSRVVTIRRIVKED